MVRKRTIAGVAGFAALMALIPWSAGADQVFLDDVIVDGSLCVGVDCSNGESFGFDTIRLKENNLRINFEDTSVSASFPTNDWQLQANETSNGGKNWFTILDDNLGRRLLTVEAGAPNNALYVDAQGDLGLNTSTPAVEFEIRDGDSPTVRLNQDGSSGFTPQTWDLAGNETNFFVRDVTNGSQLPFRIRPNATSDAIVIEGGGDVGLGTDSPIGDLHIRATAAEAGGAGNEGLLRLQNSNSTAQSTRFYIQNSAAEWFMQVSPQGDFRVSNNAANQTSINVDDLTGDITLTALDPTGVTTGNITLDGNVTVTGTCTGC